MASVLAQNFDSLELLVIDDGSTDFTPRVVKEAASKDKRIKLISNKENLGIQKTLNYGISLAKGEYIARIDDDDQWVDTGKLSRQVEFLDKNPKYVLVGTGVIVVDESREELFRYLAPEMDDDIRKKMLFRSYFTHSSVVLRKDAVVGLGGYSEEESTRHVEDYDLWLKLGTVGKFANIPSYDVRFMLRDGAISAKHKPEQFRRNIGLVKKFRKDYPSFFLAFIYAYIRSWSYSVYIYAPLPLKRLILEIYKRF